MKQVNLENVQEAGSFERLPAGGYVCKYTKVEDMPDKEYLYMEYDIVHGEYKYYYKQLEQSLQFWGGRVYRSYKEKALPMFKRMCSAVAKSNPGFIFDGGKQNSDERTLVGKYVGLILGEEEYIGNDGSTKTRLYVYAECDINDIKAGKFKVPELKKLKESSNNNTQSSVSDGFMNIPDGTDEEIPFD